MEELEKEINTGENQNSKKDILLAVIITEVICITIIFAGILLMKYFSANNFDSIRDFYSEHFKTETTVSEVIRS